MSHELEYNNVATLYTLERKAQHDTIFKRVSRCKRLMPGVTQVSLPACSSVVYHGHAPQQVFDIDLLCVCERPSCVRVTL